MKSQECKHYENIYIYAACDCVCVSQSLGYNALGGGLVRVHSNQVCKGLLLQEIPLIYNLIQPAIIVWIWFTLF